MKTFDAPWLVLNRLLGRLINLPLSLVRSLKRRLIKRRLISILDGMHRSVPGAPERHESNPKESPEDRQMKDPGRR